MSKRVFVRGLSRATSHESLRRAFTPCGNVLDAQIAKDEDGRSRGYGFVTFERAEGARRALDTLQGVVVDGCAMSIQNPNSALPKTGLW